MGRGCGDASRALVFCKIIQTHNRISRTDDPTAGRDTSYVVAFDPEPTPQNCGFERSPGQTPDTLSKEKWYRDIGGGMGQALNAASAMNAYTLSDRGSWLSERTKLFNPSTASPK
jgi:ABC-type tungstate transport system permease subunit